MSIESVKAEMERAIDQLIGEMAASIFAILDRESLDTRSRILGLIASRYHTCGRQKHHGHCPSCPDR